MDGVGDIFDDLGPRGPHTADGHIVGRRRPTSDEAIADLQAAWDAVQVARDALPKGRWWRRRRYLEAAEVFDAANRRFQHAFAGIAWARVGSVPGCWGLLSDGVESALEDYLDCDIGDELRERLKAIRAKVFEARIAAHTGDRDLEMELTRELASCLELESSDEQARHLIHHLASWARPIPDVDLAAAADTIAYGGSARFAKRYFDYMDTTWFGGEPQFQLVTFTVTFYAIDTLELHDIVVRETLTDCRPTCSPGLGTAALEHLCRSADHYGLAIILKIMPGDRTEESAGRLARWYGRHGFDIQQQTPGAYLWAKGHRAPSSGPS